MKLSIHTLTWVLAPAAFLTCALTRTSISFLGFAWPRTKYVAWSYLLPVAIRSRRRRRRRKVGDGGPALPRVQADVRQGDGQTQSYQLSYGVGSDRVQIVAGGDYIKQDAVRSSARAISLFPNPGQTSCTDPIGGCRSATPNGRFIIGDSNLTLRAPVIGRTAVFDPTLATGDFKTFTSADRFNFAPFNYFETPSERYGAFLNARAEFSDALNLRVKAITPCR